MTEDRVTDGTRAASRGGHTFAARLRRVSRRTVPALVLLCVGAAACERPADDVGDMPYLPLVSFDTASAAIITGTDTLRLSVELAASEDQRAYGLMERSELPADAGMIFLYTSEQPADAGFWMYRTRIPLDIAFLDEAGTIVRILPMEPCPAPDPRGCRSYPPGVPYFSALEVNRGYFARHGVTAGNRVIVERPDESIVH
jgi:uncharacterized protein